MHSRLPSPWLPPVSLGLSHSLDNLKLHQVECRDLVKRSQELLRTINGLDERAIAAEANSIAQAIHASIHEWASYSKAAFGPRRHDIDHAINAFHRDLHAISVRCSIARAAQSLRQVERTRAAERTELDARSTQYAGVRSPHAHDDRYGKAPVHSTTSSPHRHATMWQLSYSPHMSPARRRTASVDAQHPPVPDLDYGYAHWNASPPSSYPPTPTSGASWSSGSPASYATAYSSGGSRSGSSGSIWSGGSGSPKSIAETDSMKQRDMYHQAPPGAAILR